MDKEIQRDLIPVVGLYGALTVFAVLGVIPYWFAAIIASVSGVAVAIVFSNKIGE